MVSNLSDYESVVTYFNSSFVVGCNFGVGDSRRIDNL